MIYDTNLRYTLLFMISSTALIYFLAAYHVVDELKSADTNLQERFGDQVELTLFLIVGLDILAWSYGY